MHKFILRDKPEINIDCKNEPCWENEHWIVVQVIPEKMIVCEFIGSDDGLHLPKDIAPLVAGDYVEMLNEKYLDKVMNAEWGKVDKQARFDYHLKMARKYANKNIRVIKGTIKKGKPSNFISPILID